MPDSRSQLQGGDNAARPHREVRSRNWWVGISVIGAFILFFIFVTVLAIKWVQVHVPNSVVEIINIPESLDGTTLQVTGDLLPNPLNYELSPKLRGPQNRIRVYLDAGYYRMSILRNGVPLFSEPFSVSAAGGVRFDFKRLADIDSAVPASASRAKDSIATPP